MPNWCNNSVTFRHSDPEQISRVVRGFTAEKLFAEFLPCPPDLLAETPIGEDFVTRNDAQKAINLEKYGYEDWHGWCRDNWGTKWDVSTGEWDDADLTNPNQVIVSFETAWQPPVAFYEKLTELGFEIEAWYLEEGAGFVGKYTSANGDESFNFDGAEDLEDIADDVRQFWDLDTICEFQDPETEDAD